MPDAKDLASMPLEERTKLKWNDSRILDYVGLVEAQFNIPKDSLRTLLYSENSYIDKKTGDVKLNTTNDSTVVSRAKARGVMQITDKAQTFLEGRWKHNALDPIENIWYAADLFDHILNKESKGNVVAAIANYNGGSKQRNLVLKNKMPNKKETADYLRKAAFHADTFDSEDVPKNTEPQPQQQVAQTTVEQPSPEQTAMP